MTHNDINKVSCAETVLFHFL